MKTKNLLALPFALLLSLAATGCPSPDEDKEPPAPVGGYVQPSRGSDSGDGDEGDDTEERSSEIGCRSFPKLCFEYDDLGDECSKHGCWRGDRPGVIACNGTPTPCARKESQDACEAHGCVWGPVAEFDDEY